MKQGASRESQYEVTFLGLRRKPWTKATPAKSKAHALDIVRSSYVVTEFLDCQKISPARLTGLQRAVHEFLGHPSLKGAVDKLRKAFRKDVG